MNPLISEAIGSIVRWALALAAGYFVEHGVWTQDQAVTYVSATTLALLSLGWSLWQKYYSRQKLVTALANDWPTTEAAVEWKIGMGESAPVSTPPTKVPVTPSQTSVR